MNKIKVTNELRIELIHTYLLTNVRPSSECEFFYQDSSVESIFHAIRNKCWFGPKLNIGL